MHSYVSNRRCRPVWLEQSVGERGQDHSQRLDLGVAIIGLGIL